MKTMLVGYDLNKPSQDYDKLIAVLKDYPNWWHHLDSTWFIKTNDSNITVRDHLKQFIDASDKLLVVDVTSDAAAWTGFNEKGSEWIKSNL